MRHSRAKILNWNINVNLFRTRYSIIAKKWGLNYNPFQFQGIIKPWHFANTSYIIGVHYKRSKTYASEGNFYICKHEEASCFASVFFKQMDEFKYPSCRASCFTLVFFKQKDEFNHLFQKDPDKTDIVARILSPNALNLAQWLRGTPCYILLYILCYTVTSEFKGYFRQTRRIFI